MSAHGESEVADTQLASQLEPREVSDDPKPRSRREIISDLEGQRRRNRPYVLAGLLILVGILVIPTVSYIQKFVLPPRKLAVRIENVSYTRGDVVDFIRFHQRLSEDLGQTFALGSSLFEAVQALTESEIAFQSAPSFGVTVDEREIDSTIRLLLGFPGLTEEEAAKPSFKSQIDEKFFQFLNSVGLSEDVHRGIVRRELIREKVRERLAEDVPRIQEQVHLYQVILASYDTDTARRVDQRLRSGESIEDLALEYSADPDKQRNRGEVGWIPRGVIPELERLLFGVDEDGNPILEPGKISELLLIPGATGYGLLYIAERAAAREVEPARYEVLKDNALSEWFQKQRKLLDIEQRILNSVDYAWVNRQVRLASLLGTPTPGPTGQFQLGEGGNIVPFQGLR